MKPIVIEVKDGKVIMDVHEFKKYIEDAYQQGRSDGSSSLTYNDPYWWRHLTTNVSDTISTTTTTATLSADKIAANGDTCGCIKGILD